ncbi:phosphoenolpyruvate--protein phosphotransferase [Halopolyspora algeriensis]|uniref:Phosphoenolpyruvate-protein phosphotransferase n=1 Tax=Halopolyspora algeriensis TaxID=1500506 RepID=A0A368VIJ3_9ACTN|nr:putative PEP-binding protein [Halopolyspora algeriensis]RCW40484.1 phosphoenolpyruvate--protein phosphotransferase [Halopolyspora algeriensis]TQM53767.1 phosphoenolpyruvate--protein phosphotransferase [Halopolyspora algeriensis]
MCLRDLSPASGTAANETGLRGVGVSSGRASGPVVRVAESLEEPGSHPTPPDPRAEAERIRPAAQLVADRLASRATAAEDSARSVLEATAAMAADPALLSRAEKLVTERLLPAERAVYETADEFAGMLAGAGEYLAARARDIQDVRDRIVAALLGVEPPGLPEMTCPGVLVARDLSPADTAGLDPALVLALVTEEGGPTSHTAILARSLGIPAVVAVRDVLAHQAGGITVDGDTGTVELTEHPIRIETAVTTDDHEWDGACHTADGHPVTILANIGSGAEARAAQRSGAPGVGLFRTEFCYLAANEEPDVADQRSAYAEVMSPFAGKPVVVRTLDAGADKPLPFLDAAAEPNPALGVRGLRVAFDRPGIVDRQLEAVAAAAADTGTAVSVMAPMVATAEEASWFAARARAAGIRQAGAMIEIPAAALCAHEILDAVDFVSIGTNDLAQYAFAADRMLGATAGLNDPWQPALLRLVDVLGRAGREHGKPVGVCGEAAADPLLAGVLLGLGATSLSVSTSALPAVGGTLAAHPLAKYREAAQAALPAAGPDQARQRAREMLG